MCRLLFMHVWIEHSCNRCVPLAWQAFVRRHLASLQNHEREELKRQAREKIARVSCLLINTWSRNQFTYAENENVFNAELETLCGPWTWPISPCHHTWCNRSAICNVTIAETEHQTYMSQSCLSCCLPANECDSCTQDIAARKYERENNEKLALAMHEVYVYRNTAALHDIVYILYWARFMKYEIAQALSDLHGHFPEGWTFTAGPRKRNTADYGEWWRYAHASIFCKPESILHYRVHAGLRKLRRQLEMAHVSDVSEHVRLRHSDA